MRDSRPSRSGRRPLVAKAALFAFNLVLAGTIHLLAPAPVLTDREAYDWVGTHAFAENCPYTIYCYRVVVPAAVHALPTDADTGWRAFQVAGNAVAGTLIAALAGGLAATPAAPLLASVVVQASYGFAFTAYDPYAADPLVFVLAALLTWCWITNRPWLALATCVIGIFTKETVALLAGVVALAALIERRAVGGNAPAHRDWKAWMLPVLASATLLASFHIVSRLWLNWDIGSNPAAQLSHGSWLGLWWRNNPSLARKAYMLFSTYGFAWVLALIGGRIAPGPWRAIALATIPAMLFLMVIQTPERALGNAFFVVIPFAILGAARFPALAGAALAANALITAKAGTSSPYLPSARWTLIPAAIATALLIMRARPVTPRPSR